MPDPYPLGAWPRWREDSDGLIGSGLRLLLALHHAEGPQRTEALDGVLAGILFAYGSCSGSLPDSRSQAVFQFMRHHLAKPLTLSDLAEVAGITPAALVRHYRHHRGTTPMRDLWRLRAEAGLRLLESTQLPLKTVAARTGFASTTHLSRLVKQVCGRGPRELRRQS